MRLSFETMAARKRVTASETKHVSENEVKEEAASDPDKNMSVQEKLDYIDREIRKLHVFCVNSGYSSAQIERYAEPFTESIQSIKRERWLKRGGFFAVFLAVAAALFYIDPVYKLMCAVGKQSAIKVLPVWDWTRLYNENCLVDNPLYNGGQLTVDDCEICEGQRGIKRVKNIDPKDLIEQYLKRDIPVIVEDGTKDWPGAHEYSIKALAESYRSVPDLESNPLCMFNTNLRGRFTDPRDLLIKAAKGELDHYFAHWENCEYSAGKAFRRLYKRPYFLPPTVEVSPNSWVVIASGYVGKAPKTLRIGQPMLALAQVKGEMNVKAKPNVPCNEICATMSAVLQEGEILVATDYMWTVEYIPLADEKDSMAIGIVGSFD